jgi:hypothetical protein
MRKTISAMAGQAGSDRWIMTGGIFLVAGCYLVTAAGHLAWTTLGAVTIAVWPAFAAPRTSSRPLILSGYGSAAITAVFARTNYGRSDK